jgi:hypothetical protein
MFLGLVLLATLSASAVVQATNQSVEEVWELPLNLSQSGAATEPRIVIDAAGQQHVLWLDELDGVVHSGTTEEGWADPQRLSALFSTGIPVLVADESGSMHAFWRDEENILFYSRLTDGEFSDVEAWTTPFQLGISVLAVEATVGEDNRLHLTYIKSVAEEVDEEVPIEEDPAGVYYRVSDDGGETWSEAAPVYNSLYYRLLEEVDAHVQIGTSRSSIFIVWDDNPNERVLSVRSSDGGETWSEIRQVDGRETLDESDAASPSQVKLVVNDEIVYLQWQAEHGESGCTLYYQWSRNGGVTWEPRQRIVNEIPVCEENAEAFFHDDLLFLLVSSGSDSYYLLAWDNGRWSEPEEQVDLVNFLDPETFRPLSLDCLQGVLGGDRFYLVGCDELGGGDVWVTSRLVSDGSAFFPPPSIWRLPQSVTSGDAAIIAPISIADADSRIHVFWSQTESVEDVDLGAAAEESIYYARWDGRAWLGPVAIVSSLSGSAENPAVALNRDGHLLLVWSGTAGDIYFSQASVTQANAASTWAEPVRLPVPRAAVGLSDILVDRAGTIHIAYTIPLNENRGVYLTKSSDGGATWSDPVTAFDGVAVDWEMVDTPHLTQTGNGNLYLLWSQYSQPPGQRPLALYYARLANGDDSWSEPELVAEGPVIWSEILGVDERIVHRVWQELDNGSAALRHEFSLDSGFTWSEPSLIFPGFDESLGAVALTSDSFDRLHLLQMTNDILRHWLWDNERWVSQDQLDLNDKALSTAESLTIATDADRNLTVIYTGLVSEIVDGELQDMMFFSDRPLEMPETTPVPLPTLTPTPLPTPTVTPTPGPSPTPTIVFSDEVTAGEADGSSILPAIFTREPLLFGLVPAVLLVLIVFLVGVQIRAVRGKGN